MDITLRPARLADAERAGAICHAAFTAISEAHRFPPDFPNAEAATGLLAWMLEQPHVQGWAAERSGRLVGSNFLWSGDAIAGVGPVTVEPGAQNAGVGRRLMEALLERAAARNVAGVRLVQAAYHGRSMSLYAKLGFVVREPLATMQGAVERTPVPGCTVRAARGTDVDACAALYARLHGFARTGELGQAIAQGQARVVERAGRISGYTTGIGFFGHAAAETNDDLKALIVASPSIDGPGLLLPTRNAELFRWALESGLRVVQPLTLMSLGLYGEPGGAYLPSIIY